jgi:hypothetical protein
LVVILQRNARLRQGRADFLFHHPAQHLHLALQFLPAELKFLARHQPVRRKPGIFAFDPAPQPANALHGEFVVQHSHDAGEFDPLEQRDRPVFGEGHDPPGEMEPAQFAVDVGFLGLRC